MIDYEKMMSFYVIMIDNVYIKDHTGVKVTNKMVDAIKFNDYKSAITYLNWRDKQGMSTDRMEVVKVNFELEAIYNK